MIWCRPVRDRRSEGRPANGDRKLCPDCNRYTVEFSERYRLTGASGRTAAWVCDCGYSEQVRTDESPNAPSEPKRRMAAMRLPPDQREKSG